jgi:hypothetical protein
MECFYNLTGKKTSVIVGTFFKDLAGGVSEPLDIIVPHVTEGWCRIRADGMGGVVADRDLFDALFFDRSLGYSFLAPLIIVAPERADGSETINKVTFRQDVNYTEVVLELDCNLLINIRFEDDTIFVHFDACKAT